MFTLSKEEHMAFKHSIQSNVKKKQLDFVFVSVLQVCLVLSGAGWQQCSSIVELGWILDIGWTVIHCTTPLSWAADCTLLKHTHSLTHNTR